MIMSSKGLSEAISRGRALIAYLTFADPNPEDSEVLMRAALDAGADVLEIGLPFSDPIADGPVIQASHQRALVHTPRLDDVFALVSRLKREYSQPIVLMGSVNLVERYGVAQFFRQCQVASVDGVLLPDVSFEERGPYLADAMACGVVLVNLVSHLCRPERLREIVMASEGFIYLMSSTGTTGERATVNTHLSGVVSAMKAVKSVPVAIGFGIGQAEQAREVWAFADGVIVGSYFVRLISEATSLGDAVGKLTDAIKRFKLA